MTSRLRGIGTAELGNVRTPRVNSDDLGDIRISLPTEDTQTAIAEFLDAETIRIDGLIDRKLRLAALLDEELRARTEAVVWRDAESIPLMFRTEQARPIMYGIVLPGPDVAPEGIPIVKGGDLTPGRLQPDLLARTTHEIEAPYARSRLRRGDILFAIRGGIGDVAVVPPILDDANITQDVARVAPFSGVSSEWLALALTTHSVRRQVAERTTGATIKGLNIWDLKRVRVPNSDDERQHRDLKELDAFIERSSRGRAALSRQIELLREHRQALVTAGVTGELDVTKAA
jgi:type I restriction enzyme S subunit